jgi:hypothetical protein
MRRRQPPPGADQTPRNRGALLAGAEDGALDKLDAEIQKLEVVASRHRERIRLLEIAEQEAEAERRIKAKEGLIQRIEKKAGEERRAAALEIAEGIAKADAGLRRLIDLARDIQAAWPWQGHELAPCLLAPSVIVRAIQHEIYRIGARPLLYGGQDRFGAGIHFPGGESPHINLTGTPDRIKPLVSEMADASSLVSRILRGKGAANPPVAPVALVAEGDRKLTPAQAEMDRLLKRQNELAQDISPEGEVAYRAVVDAIALQAALVEAEKTHGAPNV